MLSVTLNPNISEVTGDLFVLEAIRAKMYVNTEFWIKVVPNKSNNYTGRVHKTGKKYFLSKTTHKIPKYTFYTGHLAWLKSLTDEEVVVINNPEPVPYELTPPEGFTLRYYQKDAVLKVLNNRPYQHGICRLPTASGKTVCMGTIILSTNVPSLTLVNSTGLLRQTIKNYKKFGIKEVAQIGDSVMESGKHYVATIQTIANRLEQKNVDVINILANTDCLIVDEVHHAAASSYKNIIINTEPRIKVGMSATPFKDVVTTRQKAAYTLDDTYLIGLINSVLINLSPRILYTEGYISIPEIHFIKYPKRKTPIKSRKWHSVYKRHLVNNVERNNKLALKVKEEYDKGSKILILCKQIEHLRILFDTIKPLVPEVLGIHANGVLGNTTREKIENGNFKVLVSSPVFDEGIDIPTVDTVFIAGGGVSPVKVIQIAGRGLRPKKGKNVTRIYDFYDEDSELLLEHSLARIQIYLDNEYLLQKEFD